MAYTSPKSGSVINPGKRKKLPKSKVSKTKQKKRTDNSAPPFNQQWMQQVILMEQEMRKKKKKKQGGMFKTANNKYKEGE
tara:strand:- start:799 stop:1038 length:240 start_codon:yes stop_codon:yes gene_type:complete